MSSLSSFGECFDQAVDRAISTEAPVDVTAGYADRNGVTQLRLQGIHMRQYHEHAMPTFSITIAQSRSGEALPEPQPIVAGLDGVPANTLFRAAPMFGADPRRGVTFIDVRPSALIHRETQLEIAHELGHAATIATVGAVFDAAVGAIPENGLENELALYEPAIVALSKYVQKHPEFPEDYADLRAEWERDGDSAIPLVYQPYGWRYPKLGAKHEQAFEIGSAIAEAAAWREAFKTIDQGKFRPGLSPRQMHTLASRAIGTYQDASDQKLHRRLMEYALAH